MQLASSIQALSNAGYGVAALRADHKDAGLLTASGSYLFGNLIQTQADKARGVALDDIVSSAVALLRYDEHFIHMNDAQQKHMMQQFAEALSQQHDVLHDRGLLEGGIASRIVNNAVSSDESFQEKFVDMEQRQLRNNPFAGAAYLAQNRNYLDSYMCNSFKR